MNKNQRIYGVRAILEALEAGTQFQKVYLQKKNHSSLFDILIRKIKEQRVPYQYVPLERLQKITTGNHQGAIAEISEVDFQEFEVLISDILERKKNPLLILLDGITDVRNFGSIIRTASCGGVDAIIIPQQGIASINGDTIKTSAGAAFTIPITRVKHIKDAILYLKSEGIQIISATEKASDNIYNLNLRPATAIIMGSEKSGIHSSILKMSDTKAKIPINGKIESLNVSVACAIFIYEAVRQRMV